MVFTRLHLSPSWSFLNVGRCKYWGFRILNTAFMKTPKHLCTAPKEIPVTRVPTLKKLLPPRIKSATHTISVGLRWSPRRVFFLGTLPRAGSRRATSRLTLFYSSEHYSEIQIRTNYGKSMERSGLSLNKILGYAGDACPYTHSYLKKVNIILYLKTDLKNLKNLAAPEFL